MRTTETSTATSQAEADSRSSAAQTPKAATTPKPLHRRTIVRVAVGTLGVVLGASMVTAAWAYDEYVADHVEIADVTSYEQSVLQQQAAATPSSSTESTARIDPATEGDPTDTAPQVAATFTDNSYVADGVSITISTVVEGGGSDTVTYYVADVFIDDATALRAGFADDAFGTNIIADTSDIAEQNDAVFAINGDYYGFRDSGIMIRNGVTYRNDGVRTGLVAYTDGTMAVYDETTTTADELLADGAWNTWSFGPALVDGGAVLSGIEDVEVDTNFGNHSIQGEQPRTGLGIIDDNHFVFVVVDGRSAGYSRGVTMTEFADIFVDLGATTAYNLDGGGSSTMYFNGELVNNPLGKGSERGTSDIIYIS